MRKNNKSDMSVKQAGQKGGQATSETHGSEYYSQIGQKGGKIGGQRVKDLIEKGKQSES